MYHCLNLDRFRVVGSESRVPSVYASAAKTRFKSTTQTHCRNTKTFVYMLFGAGIIDAATIATKSRVTNTLEDVLSLGRLP